MATKKAETKEVKPAPKVRKGGMPKGEKDEPPPKKATRNQGIILSYYHNWNFIGIHVSRMVSRNFFSISFIRI